MAAGSDGIAKVIEKFVLNHPVVPKRQVAKKIGEIAIKEKRLDDSAQVTHCCACCCCMMMRKST